MKKFVLHPVYSLASGHVDGRSFDYRLLPMQICDGVTLEDVRELLAEDAFSTWRDELSRVESERLKHIRYALVRRFSESWIPPGDRDAFEPVEAVMACLRLIRPMREYLGMVWGDVQDDGRFAVRSFSSPYSVFEVPEVEKLFSFRTEDAISLQLLAPKLLAAYRSNRFKIRMAVEFFQAGFFETQFWKARYSLRCSAIEAIFSSSKLRKSEIAKNRIKTFLGANTCIFDAGDIPSYLPSAEDITIEKVLPELYEARNCIAHGDRIPDRFFTEYWRQGIQGPLNIMAVLDEAVSVIVRKSILHILKNNLEEHFTDSNAADIYYSSLDNKNP